MDGDCSILRVREQKGEPPPDNRPLDDSDDDEPIEDRAWVWE